MDERDIRRAAQATINQHGDDAEAHAAKLAERWEKQGEEEAAAVWRRVADAIKERQNTEPG